jgi:GIY-YIG catalytic domain
MSRNNRIGFWYAYLYLEFLYIGNFLMLGVLPIVMRNNNLSLVPVREYSNVYIQKEEILKENKGKAGVYLFTHIESGKMYIGSAKNLRVRFMQYFNPNDLERKKLYVYLSCYIKIWYV